MDNGWIRIAVEGHIYFGQGTLCMCFGLT